MTDSKVDIFNYSEITALKEQVEALSKQSVEYAKAVGPNFNVYGVPGHGREASVQTLAGVPVRGTRTHVFASRSPIGDSSRHKAFNANYAIRGTRSFASCKTN